MGTVIAFVSRKGGVAKTTACLCLAFYLADRGKRVLMIDNDSQANLTEYFNYDSDRLDVDRKTVYSAYMDGVPLEELVLPGSPALIPAGERLSEIEATLLTNKIANRATLLKERVATLRHTYDFILIDCPPALNLLVVNALTTASSLIVPVVTDQFASSGVLRTLDAVTKVRGRLNPSLRVLGILPTRFSHSRVNDRFYLAEVHALAAKTRTRMLSPIPRSTVFNTKTKRTKMKHDVAPNAAAIHYYASLGEELIDGSR